MKALIIGAGNMGLTYARSFTESHLLGKNDLFILAKTPTHAHRLRQADWQSVYTEMDICVKAVHLIIIAVKPQDASTLFSTLKQYISPDQVVLSVMAGITVEAIQHQLGITKVVRAMPNLPAEIGRGITAFTATESVTRSELLLIHNLLNTTGKAIYFDEETRIDAATAVSGSGPAYVYYFMQAMIDAASNLGFTDAEAELLVEETIMGAIHLKNHHHYTCREWITKVASRGGTTEAALSIFDRHTLRDTIQGAIEAAFNRAVELGKK